MKKISLALVFLLSLQFSSMAQIEKSIFNTTKGELEIWHIGHGTLMLKIQNKVIHVDPYSTLTDYNQLPKADLILITHEHQDHLDSKAIDAVKQESTRYILSQVCHDILGLGEVLKNGESSTWSDILIEAVPAYNIVHKRPDGEFFHPKGRGNGYVLNIGDKRIYIAGDTEDIPEMKVLQNIDIAFLPMNLPYTMTPEMTANAARLFMPKILYPYHYGNTDTGLLVELLKAEPDIELRIK